MKVHSPEIHCTQSSVRETASSVCEDKSVLWIWDGVEKAGQNALHSPKTYLIIKHNKNIKMEKQSPRFGQLVDRSFSWRKQREKSEMNDINLHPSPGLSGRVMLL